MAMEIRVVMDDRPGSLAHLGSVLGDAGVNIEAIQGLSSDGKSVVQFVSRDQDRACRALAAAALPYTRREVLVVKVLDEPGMLGSVALIMSRAGINIDAVYVTTSGLVVLGVDDLDGAIQVAAGMAVATFD